MKPGLLKGFEYTGIHVYMDNYYTNPNLLLYLHERGICLWNKTKNRIALPEDMIIEKTAKKEVKLSGGHVAQLFVRWMDKRMVYALSTVHTPRSRW